MGILPKYSSSLLVEGADLPELRADILQRLHARLCAMDARNLDLKPGSLTFSGGIFLISYWAMLRHIRQVEVRIVESDRRLRVTWEITFSRIVLVAWLLIPLMCSQFAPHWLIFLLAVSAFTPMWLFAVYLTFYITIRLFRRFITRAVLDAGGRICDR